MAGYNQQYGSIFDAPLIEARINALDKKGVYNQENGASLEMSALAARLALLDGKIAKFQGGTQFDVADLMARLNALEAPVWSPAKINFTSGLWLDQSDITTGFQDSAGTTPITTSGQFVGKRLDKSGLGNHFTQSATSSRPEWDLISNIASDYTDGINDGYSTPVFGAGAMAADMDLFLAIKVSGVGRQVVISDVPSGTKAIGVISSAGAGTTIGSAGAAWSVWVNGVQIGGVGTTTEAQLYAALPTGVWKVMEFRDLDLSAWTQMTYSLYSSLMLNADDGGLVVCPAQSNSVRGQIRTYLGSKVGISL